MDLCSLYVECAIIINFYLIRTKMSHFPGFQSDTPYVILPGASIPDIDGITSSKGGGKGDGFRKFKKHLRILSTYLIIMVWVGSYNLLIVLLGVYQLPSWLSILSCILSTGKYKKRMLGRVGTMLGQLILKKFQINLKTRDTRAGEVAITPNRVSHNWECPLEVI